MFRPYPVQYKPTVVLINVTQKKEKYNEWQIVLAK